MFSEPSRGFPSRQISEVEENTGVDRNSVKLVYESSVVVENTGLTDQKCFLFSIDP